MINKLGNRIKEVFRVWTSRPFDENYAKLPL